MTHNQVVAGSIPAGPTRKSATYEDLGVSGFFETQFETQKKFDTQTFIFEIYPLKVAGI